MATKPDPGSDARAAGKRAPRMRAPRRAGILFIVVVLTWAGVGFWNCVKPMPAGTHIASLPTRLAESQVDFIDGSLQQDRLVQRGIALVDRAEQMVVVDLCPLPRVLAEHLLARKRQRPNLKIVVVTDPRSESYGGTPAGLLSGLESAGVIVARIDLDRLRDSKPLYTSVWRLGAGWWSDPFDDTPGRMTLMASLRALNDKGDQRRILVADDGAGGWTNVIASAGATGLEIRGHLARDIASSEMAIAAWSTDDDRLPPPPPAENRSMGTIDARFLTEGAISTALRDALAVAGNGDSVNIAVDALGDRQIVDALLHAAGRGAHMQLLLDPHDPASKAVAAELLRSSPSNIEVRWQIPKARLMLIRHRNDLWLDMGSANFTRRDLDDLDLDANIELRMPVRAAPARAAVDHFAREWAGAAAYAEHVDESDGTYWRYRIEEATGLAMF